MQNCKEREVSELVLDTTCYQTAAVALYKKLGFSHVISHTNSHCSCWIMRVMGDSAVKKHLQSWNKPDQQHTGMFFYVLFNQGFRLLN